MRKLIFILLAFFAVFTFIGAFKNVQAQEIPETTQGHYPVEIVR